MIERQTVLITGCCGFLGSHFVNYLLEHTDWNIVGLDGLFYCATLKNIADALNNDRFTFIKADFCDYQFMHFVFKTYHFSKVFHIGAYTHVDNSFDNSLDFTKNNTYGTHVILELCRKYSISQLVYMSTDEVYGTVPEGHFAKETDDYKPTNPYSVSKANAEQLCKTYIDNYKTNVIIVRANNMIGTKQFIEKLVPKFIYRLLNQQTCCIHGTGQTFRTFINVRDVCKALLTISNKSKPCEIWNIGTSSKYSVLDITIKIIDKLRQFTNVLTDEQKQFLNKPIDRLIEFVQDRIFNDVRYDIDTTKIEQQLGFIPMISLDESLTECVKWYIHNQHYFDENNPSKYTKPHSH